MSGTPVVFTIALGTPENAETFVEVAMELAQDINPTLDDVLELMKSGIQAKTGRTNLTLRDLYLIWQPPA